ncbi:MAG: IS91 family transposase [Bacteroidales bacterium]|nr:IS91 family transposase [Bacteroidales bacterium]
MRSTYEVADILQRNTGRLEQWVPNLWHLRTLNALSVCRTQALGGHIDVCNNPECGKVNISYNSCRNRHCPKCQGHKREQWIQSREQELFKAPYYHVVFTLPEELNQFCLYKPKVMYKLLFRVAWQVINGFASNGKFLGAQTGMIAILHTWGQNLSFHPHLHCIVPGGGLTQSKKWKSVRGNNKFLFPVKAMSKVFRAKFAGELRKQFTLKDSLFKELFSKQWVVYCKKPFWGPAQVIEYLGRYTHKVAISNHRIKNLENGKVSFTAKDYRKGGKKHIITMNDYEFIRRFCLHILPKGFTRIRHYGILSSSLKKACVPLLQQELGRPLPRENQPLQTGTCFKCKTGKLITIFHFGSRGPPNKKLINMKIEYALNQAF